MARIVIVLFNSGVMLFDHNMPLSRQDFQKDFLMVCIEKYNSLNALLLLIETLEGCSITIANNTGDSSGCSTIHRSVEPSFVFLNQ